MNRSMDAPQLRLRWSSFLLGMIILFWLPIEDENLTVAIILAIAICFLGVALAREKRQLASRNYVWVGLLGGLCVGPVGFLLMVFKIGLHHHRIPDFTINQLFRFVVSSPIWAISGGVLGFGAYLYHISRRQ